MSTTITDMPKVTQMLDAGWTVYVYKGPLGSYEVRAKHDKEQRMKQTRRKLEKEHRASGVEHIFKGMKIEDIVEECDFHDGWLMTDDFTPEQALTRMAYKVFGEII